MRWSYKTVYYELKKEGLLGSSFLDEGEVEESLNEYGHAGWELVSLIEVKDGLIGVLKQPLDSPIEEAKEDDFSRSVNLNPPERKVKPEPIYEEVEDEADSDELILHPVEEEEEPQSNEQYYSSYEEWEAGEPEDVEEESEDVIKKERKIGEIRIE